MSGGASPGYGGSSPQTTGMMGVGSLQQGTPNSILRIIIENMMYPITIDVLHQVSCWCVSVYMYMYVCVCVCLCISVYMCVCLSVCLGLCMLDYMSVCVCVCVCILFYRYFQSMERFGKL